MRPSLSQVLAMVGRTLMNAREGAEEVLALGVPRRALLLILALVVVLSMILGGITSLIATASGAPTADGMLFSPVGSGLIQLAAMGLMIGAITWIGRAMGGTGTLEEVTLIVCWLQFVMICLQLLQIVAILILPPLSILVLIAALGLFMWLLTNFVAVVHGFRSLGQVFVMILASGFAIAFFLSILLTFLGVGQEMFGGPV